MNFVPLVYLVNGLGMFFMFRYCGILALTLRTRGSYIAMFRVANHSLEGTKERGEGCEREIAGSRGVIDLVVPSSCSREMHTKQAESEGGSNYTLPKISKSLLHR